MRNKILLTCLLLINTLFVSSQLTINENRLLNKDGVYKLNNQIYNGNVHSFYSNGQIKSKYTITNGLVQGVVEEFSFDEDFQQINFLDTVLISNLKIQIDQNKLLLIKSQSDSVVISNQIADFINYKLGGLKKAAKMRLKNSEGKLKEKEKMLFDSLLVKENTQITLTNTMKKINADIINLQNLIFKEEKKPVFVSTISAKYETKNSLKSGSYQEFSQDGVKLIDGQYLNGKQNGTWTYYFPNGKIKITGNFVEGDGGNKSETSGIPKNGRDGVWLSYYSNGNKDQVSNYSSGQLKGIFKAYYENGQLSEECNYSSGQLNGIFKTYYENGQLKEECNYLKGEVTGLFKTYYLDGKIKQESTFLSGKLNGITKVHDEKGQIKKELIYKSGKLNGQTKLYGENNKVIAKITCLNDREHGPFSLYYESGNIHFSGTKDSTSKTEEKIYGELTEFNENGQVKNKVFIDEYGNEKVLFKEKNDFEKNLEKTKNEIHKCHWCGKSFKGLGWSAFGKYLGSDDCQAQENWVWLGSGCCSKKCAIEDCYND
jgi:antitoxin component YwqK of YwqJK toxin-antitoxin module